MFFKEGYCNWFAAVAVDGVAGAPVTAPIESGYWAGNLLIIVVLRVMVFEYGSSSTGITVISSLSVSLLSLQTTLVVLFISLYLII